MVTYHSVETAGMGTGIGTQTGTKVQTGTLVIPKIATAMENNLLRQTEAGVDHGRTTTLVDNHTVRSMMIVT